MSLPEVKATYPARAIGCYFGKAGEDGTGNTQVFVPFRISFEDGNDHITWAGTLPSDGGKAFEIAIKALRTLGWQGEDLSELEDLDEDGAAKLLPNEAEIVCDMEEYRGERKLKVKWVNAPGGGKMTKHVLAGADLKTFAAQMRGSIRSMAGPRTAGQRPAQRPAATAQRPTGGGGGDFGGYGGGQRDPHPNAPGGGPNDDIPFLTADIDREPSAIARVLRTF